MNVFLEKESVNKRGRIEREKKKNVKIYGDREIESIHINNIKRGPTAKENTKEIKGLNKAGRG